MRPFRSLASIVSAMVLLGLALASWVLAEASLLTERERLRRFEEVWNLIRSEYYDPGFGGNDWVGIGNRYRVRLGTVRTDEELHLLLAEMVAQLHDTHTYYAPPPDAASGPQTTLGIVLDELEGQVVVTSVENGSEAALRGVRPGMTLVTLDGRDLRERAREVDARLTSRIGMSTDQILIQLRLKSLLNGPAGKEATLGLRDPAGQLLEVRLPRSHIPTPVPQVSLRRLAPDVGYLHWTGWEPASTARIQAAISSFRDSRSLILDLRGNGGGDPQVLVDVIACLSKREVSYGRFQGPRSPPKIRKGVCPFVYTGSLAVLMDRVTGSTSEIFANLIQETGRGRLVGEPSSGSVLYHQQLKVRGGGIFWCSRWGYVSAGGKRLDRTGVTPDLPVHRRIDSLWQGRDEVDPSPGN